MNTWGKWADELHYDHEQVQRIELAREKKITKGIMEINREVPYIVIQGSGEEPYMAMLKECDCFDFNARHKPCKHMYRLAIELGLLETPAQTEEIDHQAEMERYKQLYKEGKLSAKTYVALCKALKGK